MTNPQTAAPGVAETGKLHEVEQTIAMVQQWHDSAEYISDDPELDRIDFSKIISVLGDFRTALLAGAATQNQEDTALLFEHEDGRYAVNPDTTGDPKWHRLGPVSLPKVASHPPVPVRAPQVTELRRLITSYANAFYSKRSERAEALYEKMDAILNNLAATPPSAAPAEPLIRNDPLSALSIRLLVSAGHVTQEKADEAFSIACQCLEAEADKMNAKLPWVTRRAPPLAEVQVDAARYRIIRRGQHWSVINGVGDTLRAEGLDAACDAAIASHQAGVK